MPGHMRGAYVSARNGPTSEQPRPMNGIASPRPSGTNRPAAAFSRSFEIRGDLSGLGGIRSAGPMVLTSIARGAFRIVMCS
jgi:hypothetical protein